MQLQRSGPHLLSRSDAQRDDAERSGDGSPFSGRNNLRRSNAQRDVFRTEQVKVELRQVLQRLQRATFAATGKGLDKDSFRDSMSISDHDLPGEADANGRVVSALKEANIQLQQNLSEAEAKNNSVAAELQHHEERHEKRQAEMQEQLQVCRNVTENDTHDWKGLYYLMVERVGALAEENDGLHDRCRQLEDGEARHREESEAMQRSVEESARLVASMSVWTW